MNKKICLIDVTLSKYKGDIENIGLCSIASYLRKNLIDIDLMSISICEEIKNIANEIYERKYSLIGFSMFHTNTRFIYKLCEELKKLNPSIIIYGGGKFATNCSELILDNCKYIDFILLGDGEEPTLEIANHIDDFSYIENLPYIKTRNTTVNKSVWKTNCLSNKPWPSRDFLIESSEYFTMARLSASRGCCGSCTFCCVHNTNSTGKAWIGRDILDVFAEVIYLYKIYDVKTFLFCDGSFEDPGDLGKKRIKEFCELILKYGVTFSFRCFIRAETFKKNDEKLIELMAAAGFTMVYIGIESGNERDLEIYNKRASIEDNHNAISLFSKHGINVFMGFIMFNPYSTENTILNNYNFLVSVQAYRLDHYVRPLELYYGTKIDQQAKKDQLLKKDYTYLNPDKYIFVNKNIERIVNFIKEYILNSKLMEYDNSLYDFLHLVYSYLALYPDKDSNIKDALSVYKQELFNIFSEYFKIIYVENNIEKAKEKYNDFYESAEKIYKKINDFKIKFLLNKKFRTHIKNKKNKLGNI